MTTSPEYQDLLRELHARETSFAGGSHVLTVAQLMKKFNIASLSDYGAGKMRLADVLRREFALEFEYRPYDPAFPEYGQAQPADLVCCIEVLEHVEPEHIDGVLQNLAEITRQWGFFTIHCADSGKFLADGRNAHILQRPIPWWLTKLSQYFEIQWLNKTGPESFAVVVTRADHHSLKLSGLELFGRDSIKQHLHTCITAINLEIGRRLRRGHWRPR